MTLFAGIVLWVVLLFPCAVPGFGQFSGGKTMDIPDSSVGTLFPFVKKIAERNPVPKYRFLREEFTSPEMWRRQAQPLVMANLHYEPAPVDPKPEVIEKIDLGTHSREYIRFNTTPESRISGYVLVPKGEGPFPALVALHDHGAFYLWGKEKLVKLESEHPALVKFRETCYGGVAIADELAKRGYVVAVIDMLYWGERRMLLPGDPKGYLTRSQDLTEEEIVQFNRRSAMNEQIFARTLMAAGTTWFGVIHWDDRRTVDYLLTRPEVDPNRIGCVGLSVGGYRAVHLTALDDRIRAGVGVGWMCTYGSMLQKHIPNGIGLTKIIPGTYE
jgi:dienelactone hydrolase